MTELKFTSEAALKRSIRLKYPTCTKEQWKATFLDLKKYVNKRKTTEQILDEMWQVYKKDNGMP